MSNSNLVSGSRSNGLVLLLGSAGHDVVAVAGSGPEVLPALLTHQKRGLPPSDSGHRRVLAVLAYLNNA